MITTDLQITQNPEEKNWPSDTISIKQKQRSAIREMKQPNIYKFCSRRRYKNRPTEIARATDAIKWLKINKSNLLEESEQVQYILDPTHRPQAYTLQ